TPMGYVLDEEGRIASPVGVGADALLALARAEPAADGAPAAAGHEGERQRGNRPLSESHIQRNGLAPGTPAPPFRLPRVDGGELSLEELRGRKVLLVFSDPNCGPCDAVSPRLEEVHRSRSDIQVLMISRGTVEENAPKV